MRKLLTLILGFWMLTLALSASAAGNITWREWSPQVFKDAKAEHKLVMVFGKAEWCPWCQRMNRITYADPEVIAAVQKDFIAVHVDVDADAALANQLHISDLPTILFMNADQVVLKESKGYTLPGTMLRYMKEAVAKNS